jgi:hypothetical protein
MIKNFFKTQDHKYPLMRDPQRNPRYYELTDKEREEAARQVDRILRERDSEHAQGYYGA